MLNIIKQSCCFRFIAGFIYFFSECFEKSVLKKFIAEFKSIFKLSGTYKTVRNYFDKKPYFLNSAIYRGIKFIGKRTGKIADRLNFFIIKIFKGSFTAKLFSFYKSESLSDKFTIAGLFFMTVSLSYLVFSIILGENYEYRIYVSWGLFFLGILIVSIERNIETVKKSYTYKIAKYIVELVKM